MKMIIGLGNPGDKYELNRHNIGFLFLDYLKNKYKLNDFKKKKNFFYSLNQLFKDEVCLIKPKTFMNLSGLALTSAMAFFKIKPADIIIIYDDVALPFGKIRIREKGSDGGHNGIKNIIQQLGGHQFNRIRIGIGAPEHSTQMISHVLGDFNNQDLKNLSELIFPNVENACEMSFKKNIKEAMNNFNGKDIIQ